MSKQFSVIIVPHDNRTTWSFRVSYRLVLVFGVLVGLAIISMTAFLISFGRIAGGAQRSASLARENGKLRQQLAEVDSLRIELGHLQALGLQLKGMLGLPLSPEDSALVASLSPADKSPSIKRPEEDGGVGPDEQRLMLEAMPSKWPVKGYVTREFFVTGGEKSPQYHPGMDIAAPRNTPVYVAADGVVEVSRFDDTYGWVVEVDHGYGIRSVYGHNTRNLVSVGDRVARGKTIAFVGSTGKSTAPHLHFEVRENGVPVDPRKYLLN
ncbi:MAG TPA: peptidoglycan DD-metalloendopeptidase family protein [Candidatus Krumholzibacteria bacterium]|nr:peptidoglycan DD-metalloendopeptidase family protein [Candidatus Krumholzibacteria bacterium]